MQRWHVFDEERIDFIEIERSRLSLSSSENSRREESHADDIMTKKKRQKKKLKNCENFEDKKSIRSRRTIYEKTKLEKKRQEKKDVFYVETDLRLIFAQSTTHFRIHSAKSTAFLIHERWSLSMNSSKIITKNSIWILTRSKWSTSRLAMREMKISRMRSRSFLEMKKIIHSDKWKSQAFRRLSASNAILSRSCSLCWSRQMTNDQRISISWQRSIKISIKKYFFISTSSLNWLSRQ